MFTKLALEQDRLVERQPVYLNLPFDQQLVDCVPASRSLQSAKRYLENPASLML